MSGSLTLTWSIPDFLLSPWGWALFGFYIFVALVTFGWYLRSSRSSRSRLATLLRLIIFSVFWPFYWFAIIGPVKTLHALSFAIRQIRTELLFFYYSLALVFVPAYQLYFNWDRCVGASSCAGVVIKAFLTGLVWPILIAAKVAGH